MAVVWSVGISLALFLGLHVLIWRASPSSDPRIRRLAVLGLVSLGVAAAAYTLLAGVDAAALCAVVWIELFLIISYFFVYAGVARSVSVTILARLVEVPEGVVSFDALVEGYRRSSRFADRIALMEKNRLVRRDGETVHLTPRGRVFSRGMCVLSRLTAARLEG